MHRFISNINFEKVYFFIVFLFAARATTFTTNLDFRINPIGVGLLLLPTIYLINKYKISFLKGNISIVVLVLSIWTIIHFFVDKNFNIFTYYILYLQLLVCYVVISVYQKKIYIYFEKTTVYLCSIAITLWSIMQITGTDAIAKLGFMEPSSDISKASLLIFNVPQNFSDSVGLFGLTRNCGFAWEPGLFSCFIITAIFFNISRKNKIKNNKALYILVLTLLSTSSTTGYTALLFLTCNYFFLQNKNIKYKIFAVIIIIPLVIWFNQLPFMSDKIEETSTFDNFISQNDNDINYFEENESQIVVQRFEGLYLDYLNFINAPLIGYGDRKNSYSANNISPNLLPADGIISLFAQFGIIIGLLIFMIYYKSAKLYDITFHQKYRILFFLYIIISFSYNFNYVALFMAIMWNKFLLNNNSTTYGKYKQIT